MARSITSVAEASAPDSFLALKDDLVVRVDAANVGAPSGIGDIPGLTEALSVIPSLAPLASPALTGTPTAPTAPPGTSTTQIATTAFVEALAVLLAPLSSPALTGAPTAPTAAPGDATTKIATTGFVASALAALVGSAPSVLDTLEEIATALQDEQSATASILTSIALRAPLASPALTGTPTAPTAAPGTNTTQIATTAFVLAALAAYVSVTYAGSGGDYGDATSVARSDHKHGLATALVDGFMDAASFTKVAAMAPSTLKRGAINPVPYSPTTTTITAINTLYDPAGSANFVDAGALDGAATIYALAKVSTGSARATAWALPQFSLSGAAGPWLLADGYDCTTGAPTDATIITYALANNQAVNLASGADWSTLALTTHSSLRAIQDITCRVKVFDTASTASLLLARFRIDTIRAEVLGANPPVPSVHGRTGNVVAAPGDYTADQVTDAADGSKLIMLRRERQLLRRQPAPMVYLRGRRVFDVTRAFGANNLAADWNWATNTGTDDLPKAKLIRDYLVANGLTDCELQWPSERCSRLVGALGWWGDKTRFVGRGNARFTGIINDYATYHQHHSRALHFGGLHPNDARTWHGWRYAKGAGGGDDLLAGDDAFTAPVTGDYDAVQVGDLLLFVSGRWKYTATGNLFYPCGIAFAVATAKAGSSVIKLDRAFPYDLPAALNASAGAPANTDYSCLRADGTTLVPGCAFIRINAEAPGWGAGTAIPERSYDFMPREVELHNLYIGSRTGNPIFNTPPDAFYQNLFLDSRIQCIVDNGGVGARIWDCTGYFARSAVEHAWMGSFNDHQRNRWHWNGDTTYGTGNDPSWLQSVGEGGRGNKFRDIIIDATGWNGNPTTSGVTVAATRLDGPDNSAYGIRVLWSSALPTKTRALDISFFGDEEYLGGGNIVRNYLIENDAAGVTYTIPALRVASPSNELEGIDVVLGSGSTISGAGLFFGGNARKNYGRDIRISGSPPVQFDATATNCRLVNYDGTTTGTVPASTVLVNCAPGAARPEMWR